MNVLTTDRRAVLKHTTVLFATAAISANLIGVLITFGAVYWLVPVPVLANSAHVRHVNLLVITVYLLIAVPVGGAWAMRQFRPVRDWLLSDLPPTRKEQLRALRAPLWQMRVHATLWGIGVAIFIAVNLFYSARTTLVIGISGVLGALGVCAFGYVVVERVTRDVARLALAFETPERPAVPGLTTRVLVTWALGTGTPVLGVALIGAGVLLGILPSGGNKLAFSAMLLSFMGLLIGVQTMWLVTRSIADPVESVREAMDRISRGDLEASVAVYDGSEIGLLQTGFNNMAAGLRERERVRDIFGRHVGEDVAEQALTDGGIALGGEVREIAVLFIDLVGSTALASTRPAPEVVQLLNQFFSVVIEVVARYGGSVNKFEGDAALCIFGAPADHSNAAGSALAAARELIAALTRELPQLSVGIGVSAGEAVAGNIGAAARFEYTVIGDPVNEAARLTEIAKNHPGQLLASGTVVELADPAEAKLWSLGESIELRGRSQATRIATPTGV